MDLVEVYPLLTTIDSIQFYQLYQELKNRTLELQRLFVMKRKFDEHDCIAEPAWLTIDKKTESEIESYAKKVELLHSSAELMRRTHKNGADTDVKR